LEAAGNRKSNTNYLDGTTSNFTYDPLYQLLQVTQGASITESYTYDAGNMVTDASGKSYTWDFENRLTQSVVHGTNGGTTPR